MIAVTGGAGFIGSAIIWRLNTLGEENIIVVDELGQDDKWKNLVGLRFVDFINKNDFINNLEKGLKYNFNAIIHMGANSSTTEKDADHLISNNYEFTKKLAQFSLANKVRFIYASSSSVYGVKSVDNVTEDMALEPLTDYSKFKALCEDALLKYQSPEFTAVIVRPATVCGYSPRQRLDLAVNILTNHAVNTGKIKVFGGEQKRPNIHIKDIVAVYLLLLEIPSEKIAGKIFNAGYENHTVKKLADIVRNIVDKDKVELITVPTDDNRSYHISSEKIKKELGFIPRHKIEDAVEDLVKAFKEGKLSNSMSDSKYFNIKKMQEINLK